MNQTFKAPGLRATASPRNGTATAALVESLAERIEEMLDGTAKATPAATTATRKAKPAPRIAWRALAEATFSLPDGWQWEGKLPRGMAQQQFRAKLGRQAAVMGGKIGIRTKGERWWCWAETRPSVAAHES